MSESIRYPRLDRADLEASPFRQFDLWFEAALQTNIMLPEAMVVATANESARPSARYVLLRGHGESGFVFNTNYNSHKAQELIANPQASLLFYWDVLGRQVRISGVVEKVEPDASDEYFLKRPRQSRLSALTSPQSEVIESREQLEERYAQLETQFEGQEIDRPDNWGGFRVIPDEFEFWQHQDHRLHDRFRYRLQEDGAWVIERLGP